MRTARRSTLAKGLVKRDVVRVVTPGTLTDESLLDPRTANYLAAIVESGNKLGLAWVELSTGRFCLAELAPHRACRRAGAVDPAETLISELSLDAPWLARSAASSGLAVTIRPSWDFQPEQARKTLHEHFGTTTLDGFGVDDRALEVQAAGALVAYLRETQKSSLGHITGLSPYRKADALGLDEMTRRSLELTRTLREGKREGSLLQVIDRTVTPMGARLLAEYLTSPLTSPELIEERLEAVDELVRDSALRADLRELLGEAYDLERLAARVGDRPGHARATWRPWRARWRCCRGSRPGSRPAASKRLTQLEAALELCPEVRAAIEAALVEDPPLALKEGGLIRPDTTRSSTSCVDIAEDGKSWIAKYQAEQIRRTGITGLKVGFNQVFGYYIEVTHAQAQRSEVPPTTSASRRSRTPSATSRRSSRSTRRRSSSAEDRANALEYELFIDPARPGRGRAPRG